MDNFTRMIFPVNAEVVEVTPPHVTPNVEKLLLVLGGKMNRATLQGVLDISDAKYFRAQYLNPAFESGLVELTIPDKPKSVNQKYRKVKENR